MSERNKIEEKLRKKEQEIANLEDKIKSAKVYVQALRDILKLLGTDNDDEADAESTLRPGSAVDQARQVILDAGVPLHIDHILNEMGKEPTREHKASLTSSLAAYVRRGEIFNRPAPNTFGLVELAHSDQFEEASKEPPDHFGRAPNHTTSIDDEVDF